MKKYLKKCFEPIWTYQNLGYAVSMAICAAMAYYFNH